MLGEVIQHTAQGLRACFNELQTNQMARDYRYHRPLAPRRKCTGQPLRLVQSMDLSIMGV